MKFENTFLSREHRYWLGVEKESGDYFLAIPVANNMVDYVEAYRLSAEEYGAFLEQRSAAINFV